MDVTDYDATALAERIRTGELSVRRVVEAYIRRIEAVNPVINAVCETRYVRAREEAAACDEWLADGEQPPGPLFGVPVTVKECFDVAGMHTTGGLPGRRDVLMTEDAELVARLRAAGAIVLAKTNTPALCFCQETDNRLYGRTANPWDPDRTAGGSSGGEAALVAAGGSPLGLGNDIGGSIRLPAHCCGVIGFRTGAGAVPASGSFPGFGDPLQAHMQGAGALARSARDARRMETVLTGAAARGPALADQTVVLPESHLPAPAGRGTRLAMRRIRELLAPETPPADEPIPGIEAAATRWQRIMSIAGAAPLTELAGRSGVLGLAGQWLRGRVNREAPVHPYLSWALLGARLFAPSPRELARLRCSVPREGDEVRRWLAGRVLILPVYHRPAPPHGVLYREIFSPRRSFRWWLIWVAWVNLWGLPALTLPVGEEDGLPVALQLVGAPGEEGALFELAHWLQPHVRGWKRAPLGDDAA